jgi:ribosome maturation protein Sdo1
MRFITRWYDNRIANSMIYCDICGKSRHNDFLKTIFSTEDINSVVKEIYDVCSYCNEMWERKLLGEQKR